MYFKGDTVESVFTGGFCDDDWGRKRFREESMAAFARRAGAGGSAVHGGHGVPDDQRVVKGLVLVLLR
jgi:hypothetical protein